MRKSQDITCENFPKADTVPSSTTPVHAARKTSKISSVFDLPTDCLGYIFGFVNRSDIPALRLVSKQFSTVAASATPIPGLFGVGCGDDHNEFCSYDGKNWQVLKGEAAEESGDCAALVRNNVLYWLSGNKLKAFDLIRGVWNPDIAPSSPFNSRGGTAYLALTNDSILWTGRACKDPHMFSIDLSAGQLDKWTAHPAPGDLFGLVVVGNQLHALLPNSDLMRYDTAAQQWVKLSALPYAIHYPGVVALGDYIYVLGGQNPADEEMVMSSYRFNTSTGKWERLADIPTGRFGGGCVVWRDRIYCTGGVDHDVMETVESYDPATNTWRTETDMDEPYSLVLFQY
eukprot:TRINITY_DN649_c0_g1_i2.p1 TRINITY_DN649_c0_g1~~TRINITY_DN649_c0_g1_i2.p1  ORF type:complete len:343 (-),score=40.10 TRINITY_DN649_c0_g1_i2:47-1075(-)